MIIFLAKGYKKNKGALYLKFALFYYFFLFWEMKKDSESQ